MTSVLLSTGSWNPGRHEQSQAQKEVRTKTETEGGHRKPRGENSGETEFTNTVISDF